MVVRGTMTVAIIKSGVAEHVGTESKLLLPHEGPHLHPALKLELLSPFFQELMVVFYIIIRVFTWFRIFFTTFRKSFKISELRSKSCHLPFNVKMLKWPFYEI